MNKKQLAILSVGNILHKDEGLALYASKYLEVNYSVDSNVDIIHNTTGNISLVDVFTDYEEIIVLDVIGIEDAPGSIYEFPMDKFRGFSTDEEENETSVLGCLNLIEREKKTLPKVSLFAIIPDVIEAKVGLSESLYKPLEAYVSMVVKSLESKGFTCEAKTEKQTIENIIGSFIS